MLQNSSNNNEWTRRRQQLESSTIGGGESALSSSCNSYNDKNLNTPNSYRYFCENNDRTNEVHRQQQQGQQGQGQGQERFYILDPIVQQQQLNLRRRNHSIVLFWFVLLALAYASERSTFKLLVDYAEPFRLLYAQIVMCAHAILLGSMMLLEQYVSHYRQKQKQKQQRQSQQRQPIYRFQQQSSYRNNNQQNSSSSISTTTTETTTIQNHIKLPDAQFGRDIPL